MKNKWVGALLLLLAILTGIFFYSKFRVAPSIDFSKISLVNEDGSKADLRTFTGRKTVICFSATWCGNCWQELGEIDRIKANELNDVDFVVISDEPAERIEVFKRRLKGPFTYLRLTQPFSSIGIHSIPTSYIVNTHFEIKKEHVGYIDWNDLSTREHLKKLME
jgi:peroxiredoxin